MEQVVRVHKTNDDGTAQVLHIRKSACSGDCHKCSGCGAVQERMILTVNNPIHATVGDVVTISTNTRTVLLSAVVLYMIPVILFFAGYLMGLKLAFGAALIGCIGFILGIVFAVIYDRRVLARKKESYTITGFAHNNELEG